MDLTKYHEVRFEPGKKYHCIITKSEEGTNQNGKDYVAHTITGQANQTFEKKFYLTTEKAMIYYTGFLTSCGVKKEELKDWDSIKLNGKMIDAEFNLEEYEAFNDDGSSETRSALRLKRFSSFSGNDGDKTCLEPLYDNNTPF